MAKKEDRKKQKKRLKDRKKAIARHEHLAAKALADRYPKIIIDPRGGDPEFVDEVRRVVKEFSFANPACCDEIMQNNYMLMRQLGMEGWGRYCSRRIRSETASSSEAKAELELHGVTIFSHLGKWIFEHLPAHLTSTFSLTRFYRVDLTDSGVVIRFSLLQAVDGPANPLFIPPDEPTVVMQGAKWRVGLYRHALEQWCCRMSTGQTLRYSHYLDLFTRFAISVFTYTPVALSDGQEALRVDFALPLTNAFYDYYIVYTRKILGLADTHVFPRSETWHAVLGYLPLQIQGKYARAKTFLLPGFVKTPEYGLLRQANPSRDERAMLLAMTNESRRTSDLAGDTIAGIKWYHDNGVPQVFRATEGDDSPGPASAN